MSNDYVFIVNKEIVAVYSCRRLVEAIRYGYEFLRDGEGKPLDFTIHGKAVYDSRNETRERFSHV